MPGHSPRRPLRRRRPLGPGECARTAGPGRLVLEASGGGWAAAGRGPPVAVSPLPPLLRAGRGGGRCGLSPPRRWTEDLSGGRGWRERVGQDGWSEQGRRRAPSRRPLPPSAPQPGAGRGQVQAGAPGTSRVFLPLHAATHPGNIEEADSELREDLCLRSPRKMELTGCTLTTHPAAARSPFQGTSLYQPEEASNRENLRPRGEEKSCQVWVGLCHPGTPLSLYHGLRFGRSFEAERLLSF